MIGYLGNKKFSVNKICKDNNGRVVIIETEIETEILLNLYNSNSKTEQLQTLSNADLLLSDFSIDDTKTIVFAGDFNLFFNQKIEAKGGKSVSISKILQITEKYDLIDIWRVRNLSSTRFTFRKNHFSGFMQRQLDYAFIPNSVQESVQDIAVLPSFRSNHLSLFLSYKKLLHSNLGKIFWKFNCSLIHDQLYMLKMKKHIENIINSFDPNFNH